MTTTIEIPTQPDFRRLCRERGARLRAVMAEHGVDALVLLLNSNVSYATGVSWPVGDSGRANVERPVAVVLATDEDPAPVRPHAAGLRSPGRARRRSSA